MVVLAGYIWAVEIYAPNKLAQVEAEHV